MHKVYIEKFEVFCIRQNNIVKYVHDDVNVYIACHFFQEMDRLLRLIFGETEMELLVLW